MSLQIAWMSTRERGNSTAEMVVMFMDEISSDNLQQNILVYHYENGFTVNFPLIQFWTGWWFGTLISFFHSVGNVIIPIDYIIFFRGVGIPPTRLLWPWYSHYPHYITIFEWRLGWFWEGFKPPTSDPLICFSRARQVWNRRSSRCHVAARMFGTQRPMTSPQTNWYVASLTTGCCFEIQWI